MRTVELSCGTKSFSKVAASLGHATFTVDNDRRHAPGLVADVRALAAAELPRAPDVFWASPPCQCFSTLSIGRYWNKDRTPKPEVYDAVALVAKALALAQQSNAAWWFIENPRGMLRKVASFEKAVADLGGLRRTVTYCQYGDTRMKPTDIWTNATWWKPRPPCRNGAPCHQRGEAGRSDSGTVGLKTAVERSRIPPALFAEIFAQMPLPQRFSIAGWLGGLRDALKVT